MKKNNFIALLLGTMLSLGACSASSNNELVKRQIENNDISIVIRHFGDPMSWDPDKLPDDNGYPIFQNIFNRLVKLDSSKNIIPDLAESWEISDDAKSIKFNLRKNAKWHDGKPVTSEDVKYTFEYIKNNKSYLMNTKMLNVENFEIIDDNTIVFKLLNPDVSIVSHLGWYATFIMPKHILDNGKPWEENEAIKTSPIGSGPFKLENHKQGESIVLVKNEDYWETSPKISRIIYSFVPDETSAVQGLVNGEIDVYESVPASSSKELLNNNSLRLKLNRYPSPIRLVFNMKNDSVKDVALRKAIATAINRDDISEKVFNGIQKPEYTMYPSLIEWVSNSEDIMPKYNVNEAIKILENAGYKKDGEGYYVRGLSLECFEGNQVVDTAKIIKENLKAIGIELNLNIQEYNAWAEKVGTKKEYMMELQGGFMGPDPSSLNDRYGTNQPNNWSQYSNDIFDKLVTEANQNPDKEIRSKLYKEAQKILRDDYVFIPLVEFASYDANSIKFKNLPIDGEGKWGWQEYTFTEGE